MTTRLRSASNRRALIAGCIATLALLLAAIDGFAQAETADIATAGPDVTVFDLAINVSNYHGITGEFAAFSFGTTTCNRGGTPLNWCDQSSGCAPGATSKDHPVMAQNLYRLKEGRFEQIGMSWLKHEFAATNSPAAGCEGPAGQSCQSPPAGANQLGIGCVVPSASSVNGARPLGPRSEVNAATGDFPFPFTSPGGPYELYDQRIKVPWVDIEPSFNIGATYWAEAQYVAPDDALAGNGLNNASYREADIANTFGYPMFLRGPFFERQPAINAWKLQDPDVTLTNVDVPGTIVERFHVGRKVTDLGGGVWHYEYAVHNLNSDRSARAFEVELPVTTSFTNVGFKDIEHHSGEPYSTLDWTVFSSGGLLSWATDTFATDPNANSLRFATMYNFWFDADQPPSSAVVHRIELFKTGDPASVSFTIGNDLLADGFESGDITRWTGSGS